MEEEKENKETQQSPAKGCLRAILKLFGFLAVITCLGLVLKVLSFLIFETSAPNAQSILTATVLCPLCVTLPWIIAWRQFWGKGAGSVISFIAGLFAVSSTGMLIDKMQSALLWSGGVNYLFIYPEGFVVSAIGAYGVALMWSAIFLYHFRRKDVKKWHLIVRHVVFGLNVLLAAISVANIIITDKRQNERWAELQEERKQSEVREKEAALKQAQLDEANKSAKKVVDDYTKESFAIWKSAMSLVVNTDTMFLICPKDIAGAPMELGKCEVAKNELYVSSTNKLEQMVAKAEGLEASERVIIVETCTEKMDAFKRSIASGFEACKSYLQVLKVAGDDVEWTEFGPRFKNDNHYRLALHYIQQVDDDWSNLKVEKYLAGSLITSLKLANEKDVSSLFGVKTGVVVDYIGSNRRNYWERGDVFFKVGEKLFKVYDKYNLGALNDNMKSFMEKTEVEAALDHKFFGQEYVTVHKDVNSQIVTMVEMEVEKGESKRMEVISMLEKKFGIEMKKLRGSDYETWQYESIRHKRVLEVSVTRFGHLMVRLIDNGAIEVVDEVKHQLQQLESERSLLESYESL